MADLRLTHVALDNWRNFRRVDVALQRRVFLAGPNASGKSNFLDAFRFLGEVAATVGGGFQQATQRRGGLSAVRCLAARQQPDVAISVTIGNDEEPVQWTYEVAFHQDPQKRPRVRREVVRRGNEVVLRRPDEYDRRDSDRLTQTFLEQVSANHSFREVTEFFQSIRYLHLIPQLVREPDRSVGRVNDPYGGDLLEQIAQARADTQRARLRRIRDALRFAVPQLQELELERDSRGVPHLRGKYQHWRAYGAWQDETQLSDGTLRLVGLLWSVLDGTGPLLLEEPELSLHPQVVAQLPQMLFRAQKRSGRQIMLSSHAPELFRDEGIGLDEVLLLHPTDDGTVVTPASAIDQVADILDGGGDLADVVVARTRPPNPEQLALAVD